MYSTVFVTRDYISVFPGGGIGFIARGFVIVPQQSLILYVDTHQMDQVDLLRCLDLMSDQGGAGVQLTRDGMAGEENGGVQEKVFSLDR